MHTDSLELDSRGTANWRRGRVQQEGRHTEVTRTRAYKCTHRIEIGWGQVTFFGRVCARARTHTHTHTHTHTRTRTSERAQTRVHMFEQITAHIHGHVQRTRECVDTDTEEKPENHRLITTVPEPV